MPLSSEKSLADRDWAFSSAQTDAHVHGFHPYPARFIPQIPAALIADLSEPGDRVLDPFLGGGTTLVEATLLGRHAVGNDLNPLGVLLARVKTTVLSRTRLKVLDPWVVTIEKDRAHLAGISDLFTTEADLPPSVDPPIPNIDHWFEPTVKQELALLTVRIAALQDADVADFCRVALSAVLVAVSNQDSETRYARRVKGIQPGETLTRFLRKLADMRLRMAEYSALRADLPSVDVAVHCADSRVLPGIDSDSVDLIVTSPPYPNAFDYHLYHRFRLFWLGYDPVAMARHEIGSHLNYQRNGEDMAGFARDMEACFTRLNDVLRPRRYCCVVIGDSIFHGNVVKNDEVITEIAGRCGFSYSRTIYRELHRVKRSFASPARRLKQESIVVLQKRAYP